MKNEPWRWNRRRFLRGMGAVSGGALVGGSILAPGARALAGAGAIPRRVLGKTGEQVSVLALGTWPCGQCRSVDVPAVMGIVNEALDLGITFIDTAHNYGNAEESIGKALGARRDQVFLATKVWADTADEAAQSLEESLRLLRTDHLDLVYLHSVGNRDVTRALGSDGALPYLLRQRTAGKTRFVGISGHSKVQSFVPIIEAGEIDVVMMAMNFVDRHTYGFEDTVLPVANRQRLGVACMKVFGGIKGGFGVATEPNPGPEIEVSLHRQAIRYAMELPGVATLVIGPHTVEQLRQNVAFVKGYQPLSAEEGAALTRVGQRLAQELGPHYGPVAL